MYTISIRKYKYVIKNNEKRWIWNMVIWYMVCMWYMVYGTWYMVYGIWYMVYGIWYMVYVCGGTKLVDEKKYRLENIYIHNVHLYIIYVYIFSQTHFFQYICIYIQSHSPVWCRIFYYMCGTNYELANERISSPSSHLIGHLGLVTFVIRCRPFLVIIK